MTVRRTPDGWRWGDPTATRDRTGTKQARADWQAARRAETQYGVQLRKIARHVADIVRGHAVEGSEQASALIAALRRYAETIDPWARSSARRMVLEVEARTAREWRRATAEMGYALREQLEAPDAVAARFHDLMREQVVLIKSLPLDAAARVHARVQEGLIKGERFETIAKEIAEGGQVAKSRATLIARTETGRAATALLQARAESTGSEGYVWRTVRDQDVRPSHKAMEGKFVAWSDPPTLDNLTGHAGALPNCRCYAEPVIPLP